MSRPIIKIIDVSAKEDIVREMNDEEYEQHLKDMAASEKALLEQQAKEAEKEAAKAAVEAKLAALGLDMETVKLIAKLG